MMLPSKTVPLGVALIPDQSNIDYVCRLNAEVNKRYPLEFVLQNSSTLLPHVSLFQGQFDIKIIDEMVKIVGSKFLKRRKDVLSVCVKGINIWATKIFFLDLYDVSKVFQSYHETVFDLLNPLRNQSLGSADPQAFVGITDAERDSFAKYRYPFSLNAYRPHFTVGRSELADGQEWEFARELERKLPPPRQINFEKMVLFDVGKFGRLEKIKEEFDLSQW